jgi:hypothetical protein
MGITLSHFEKGGIQGGFCFFILFLLSLRGVPIYRDDVAISISTLVTFLPSKEKPKGPYRRVTLPVIPAQPAPYDKSGAGSHFNTLAIYTE